MFGGSFMNKKVLILEGLCCANCATKIEHQVKGLSVVKEAYVDFVNKKLVIQSEDEEQLKFAIEESKKIVNKIEPDVRVIMEEDKKPKAAPHSHSHHEHDGHDHHDHDNHDHEGHDHGHGHSHGGGGSKQELIKLGIGAALFAVGILFHFSFKIELAIFLASYLLVGGEVLIRSVKNIARGQIFDENFLMTVATIGAFAIQEFPEGVAVMLFYQVGELFQDMAVNRSRKSIQALMDIRPDYANVILGNDTKRVDPDDVRIGQLILVKPGEKLPLDGKIIDGSSMLDTSALTGESVPRGAGVGDDVLAGFINKNGVLTIEVTKEFGESTVSKILDLVQNASSKKAPTENFITKFARYYTPAVVFVAAALAIIPPFIIEGAVFRDWLYRALVFLVVSCPCALVISIPLGFFGGIGGASRNGVLIKGSNYLEALNSVDTVIFDKTGTLTKGVFKVTEIKAEAGCSDSQLLEYAAHAESFSNHPIATSILKAYKQEIDKGLIEDYNEMWGQGIKIKIKGDQVLAGNFRLMEGEGISYPAIDTIGTIVHMAINGKYAGYIIISDEVKEDAAKAIAELKKLNVKKTVMLTGDIRRVGEKVAASIGLDEVYTELLPDQKVEKLEQIQKNKNSKGKTVFVGDGINDAPVLARADIGIAMGGLGSDAAIEAADVVIMTDEPSKIATAIRVARKTRNIVWQNILLAFAVKAIVLVLSAGGLATMWEAVFADVGVALLAVLNAMRVMHVKDM
jgi:Cd2+/Zn2+-exporting ATPase